MNIEAWLQGLGLERYVPAFRNNEIDWEVLPKLTSNDLKEIGVAAVGHRRKLLDAITALGAPVLVADASGSPSETTATFAPRSDAERRQLTVMFCDLVGSTALSARLDPEDLREIIVAYHCAVAAGVGSFDGFVAKYMGDSVLVYFGYPRAHEDDAERAVRAGLGVIDAVRRLDVKSVTLQARIGIATGLVVVGDLIGEGSAQEQSVVGETPNLAARLQALAEPGTVVVAARTWQLAGRWFEYRELGTFALKGFPNPVPVWHVLGLSTVQSRFEARQESGLAPLIGRETALRTLLDLWHKIELGEGQVVLLSGEPGIGKSRIARAFEHRIGAGAQVALHFFCSAQHQDSALHPEIAQLEHAAGFSREDRPESKLAKLDALLARSGATDEEIALIAELLSIPTGERYRLPDLTPQRRRERTLQALLTQPTRLARQAPVLLIYEDVHWIDPTSLELLGLAIETWRDFPILLLMTTRPEFKLPWPTNKMVTLVTLPRLDRRDGTALVTRIACDKRLPQEVLEQILARTDGVPLFLEELTKLVLESGVLREEGDRYVLSGPLPPFAIPATLHESLLARLDRLGPAREVAQIGAALGRQFSYRLLRAIARATARQLDEALRQLTDSELVFSDGAVPASTYVFKHALVQDAAYQMMLKSRRTQLHARIADVMSREFPEISEGEPETLAHHYTAAGLAEPAINYWRSAGQRALQRSALREALNHVNAGIALLDEISELKTRTFFEIDLQVTAAQAWTAAGGYGAAEVETAYFRAHELCAGTGEAPQLFPTLYGLLLFYWTRGSLVRAREINLQLIKAANATQEDELLLIAQSTLGALLCHAGDIAQSERHLEAAQAAFNPAKHLPVTFKFGTDPGSFPWSYRAWNQALLGYPDAALAMAQEAVPLARRMGHQLSVTACICFAACCAVILRDPEIASKFAEQGMAAAREHGFPHWQAMATIYLGWSWGQQSSPSEGAAQIREGITLWRATGANIFLAWYFSLLSETELAAGNLTGAAVAAEEALHWSETNSEHAWDCFVHCHRGDALLASRNNAQAETEYLVASMWAQQRGARWGELYAGLRLARLWQSEKRIHEARELLEPVCRWFGQRLNNPVLMEAKALVADWQRA